jgi:hypothetical protein
MIDIVEKLFLGLFYAVIGTALLCGICCFYWYFKTRKTETLMIAVLFIASFLTSFISVFVSVFFSTVLITVFYLIDFGIYLFLLSIKKTTKRRKQYLILLVVVSILSLFNLALFEENIRAVMYMILIVTGFILFYLSVKEFQFFLKSDEEKNYNDPSYFWIVSSCLFCTSSLLFIDVINFFNIIFWQSPFLSVTNGVIIYTTWIIKYFLLISAAKCQTNSQYLG